MPALYGAFLMSGEPAAVLAARHLGVRDRLDPARLRASCARLWGELAGVIAAGLWAALPISHDILGWHGLAEPGGDLALLALCSSTWRCWRAGAWIAARPWAPGCCSWRSRPHTGSAPSSERSRSRHARVGASRPGGAQNPPSELLRPLRDRRAGGAGLLSAAACSTTSSSAAAPSAARRTTAAYLVREGRPRTCWSGDLLGDLHRARGGGARVRRSPRAAATAPWPRCSRCCRGDRASPTRGCSRSPAGVLAHGVLPAARARAADCLRSCSFPAPRRGRGGARARRGHRGRGLEPGRHVRDFYAVHERRLAARARSPSSASAPGRGRRHGPLLELPRPPGCCTRRRCPRSSRRTSSRRRSCPCAPGARGAAGHARGTRG